MFQIIWLKLRLKYFHLLIRTTKFTLTIPGNWMKGMYSENDYSVSDVVDSISVPSPSSKALVLGPD
jgi:hypothetical protein